MQLRSWQQEAHSVYQRLFREGEQVVSWEATPGAGKTVGALSVAVDQRDHHGRRRFAVVVPTTHLKRQWAKSAQCFGIRLNTNYQPGRPLSSGYNGIALTYHQVAANEKALRNFFDGAMVIPDEIHHTADGFVWGDALTSALDRSGLVLSLSGTPFRSDESPIPFLRYVNGHSQPDYIYSYGQAIQDRVCRPVAFFTYGGDITWEEGGAVQHGKINHDYDGFTRHLRIALEPGSGWIRPMLADAHRMLLSVRQDHPDAGGLIVAIDQAHARRLAALVEEVTGKTPVLAVSDDKEASRNILRFANGTDEWLVSVKMVSEGVDVPRLRVGVYATNVRTRMYFRQFLGRIGRVTPRPSGTQVAYCYLPAEPTLTYLAEEVEEEQRHFARPAHHTIREEEESESIVLSPEGELAEGDVKTIKAPVVSDWQIHNTTSGIEAVIVNGGQLPLLPEWVDAPETARGEIQSRVDRRMAGRTDVGELTITESEESLRREIKRLVNLYCVRTQRPFQEVYGRLNKMQNVRVQGDCTVQQLQARVEIVSRWL
jgi:superfamily II DNA or RNA helicase